MSLTTSEMTPADFGALMGNDGFSGGNGFWWIIILFIFAIFGWGGNGFGGSNGAQDNYVLASDFAQVERKLDGVNNGLCSGFYQEAQLSANTNQLIANGFANAELSRTTGQTNTIAQLNAMALSDVQNFNTTQRAIDTGIASTNYALGSATRDIIDNSNANYRALHDELVASRIEAKDERIAELTAKLNKADLLASQSTQNAYLINELRPCPIPAYITCNPYAYQSNCGCS